MEAPAIELVGYKTTQEEIIALYCKVYQLRRAPRAVPCDLEMEEEIHWEILDSLNECLRHRWGSILLEEEPRQSLIGTRTSRMTAQVEFHARVQDMYDHFQNRWQELHKEALRHWQQLPCWRATSRGWAAPSPMDGPAAVISWAVASICIVEDAQGTAGGAYQLASKSRSPQQWATLGPCKKVGSLTQPCKT